MAENKNEGKNTEQQQPKEKLELRLDNPLPFDSLIQTAYSTTGTFCDELINPLFHQVFSDFYGSKIEISMNRSLVTTLAFSENNIEDGRAHGIERTINKNNMNDIDNRIKLINNTLSSDRYHNQYRLTTDCKNLLENIVPSGARQSNGKINWSAISGEGCINNNFNFVAQGQSQILIQVQIDLNKLLRVIYGSSNEDKSDSYQYMVTLGGPINPVAGLGGQMIVKNWQLFIMKLSNKAVQEISKSYGMSGSNNLGFIC